MITSIVIIYLIYNRGNAIMMTSLQKFILFHAIKTTDAVNIDCVYKSNENRLDFSINGKPSYAIAYKQIETYGQRTLFLILEYLYSKFKLFNKHLTKGDFLSLLIKNKILTKDIFIDPYISCTFVEPESHKRFAITPGVTEKNLLRCKSNLWAICYFVCIESINTIEELEAFVKEIDSMTIETKMRDFRSYCGMTQLKLSRLMINCLSESYISQWELGIKRVPFNHRLNFLYLHDVYT